MENYGFKDLYSVALKATSNIEIGNRQFVPGEVILRFDNLQFANIIENHKLTESKGGYNNVTHVMWDNTNTVNFSCTQGVLSKVGLSVLSNAKVITKLNSEIISIPVIGEECNAELASGAITLLHQPNGHGFIYNKQTGELLYSNITQQSYVTNVDIIADYEYDYSNGVEIYEIGNKLCNGFLRLEGKTRLKDDSDGKEKTGIVIIPKIRIASGLSLRMGSNMIAPSVSDFEFIGYPVGDRGSQSVMEIKWLNNDVDSDI